jgi:hypothetical protein
MCQAPPCDETGEILDAGRSLAPPRSRGTHRPSPARSRARPLGICRALFAARKREHAPAGELDELKAIGSALSKAIELAQKTEPNTVGHRAAWDKAEMATERLIRVISGSMAVAPVVEAAVVRVRRIYPKRREADERRAAERTRR